MPDNKNLNESAARLQALRAENRALRVALRQAEDFCVYKEQKSIEYIFHISQFKSRLINRIEDGFSKLFHRTKKDGGKELKNSETHEEMLYADWLRRFDIITVAERKKIDLHISQIARKAKFTFILDCRGIEISLLLRTLESFCSQIYHNFEILLCGEESRQEQIQLRLDEFVTLRDNLKFLSVALDAKFKDLLLSAAGVISGDYIAVLQPGDRLHERMLYEFLAEIDFYPNAQALYSDEDEIDDAGRRRAPCFKTDWNLELFLGQNYIGSLCVLTRKLFEEATRKLKDKDNLEALNFYALIGLPREAIRHLPVILYHHSNKADVFCWMHRTEDLMRDFLLSQDLNVEVSALIAHPDWLEVRRACLEPLPLVTIIIPTRNRPDLLGVCLCGVLNETNYKNIEIIIVDHENTHPDVLKIFKSYEGDSRVRVMPYQGIFDHSDMNNRAAELARGDILLFLNDDIEVIQPQWLDEIVAQFVLPDRGVVGARLLYPSHRIQHAGVILGFGGVAGHGHVGLDADDEGYFGRISVASEVSALTGACMAMQRSLFEEVGGFSARHLQRTFNDVDLCLKARAKGRVNIYTPLATLIHHESATDGGDVKLQQYKRLQGEVGYMLETWGLMRADPYYNVNLALEGKSFTLAFPPRRVPPWEVAEVSAPEGSPRQV